MLAIIDFANIIEGGKRATNSDGIFGHYVNCEWRICQVYDYEIKYITTLLVEYSTFRIYRTFLLIKCIITDETLSWNDAADFHVKSLGKQNSVKKIVKMDDWRTSEGLRYIDAENHIKHIFPDGVTKQYFRVTVKHLELWTDKYVIQKHLQLRI